MNCISLISKYKCRLMGFATIIIVLYHLRLWESTTFKPFVYLSSIGYGCVDIFMLLSGFGLYYSFLKKQSVFSFYKKRLIRIMPVYMIVLALFYFVFNNNYDIRSWLYNVSTLSFWTNHVVFEWYVPSIILIYMLYPLMNVFLKKNMQLTLLIVSLLSIFVFAYFTLHADHNDIRKLFLSRIPIFCLGVFLGKLSLNKNKTYKLTKLFFILMLIPACIFLYFVVFHYSHLLWHGFGWYPFLIIAPGFCFLLVEVFEKIKGKSIVSKGFDFLGTISLEVFLVHVLLNILRKQVVATGKYDLLYINLIYILVSILLAYVLFICIQKVYLLLRLTKTAITSH